MKKVFSILFLVLMALMFTGKFVQADIIGTDPIVSSDKVWTITFNQALDPTTVSPDNFSVTDLEGNRVPIEIFQKSKFSVGVNAESGFVPGKTYTISVGEGLKTANGNKSLKSKAIKTFKVSEGLPTVDSKENLKRLLNIVQNNNGYRMMYDKSIESVAPTVPTSPSNTVKGQDYSDTNSQVEGVDEGDVVKTDGEYIYEINNGKVVIAKAYPADKMEVTNTVYFNSDYNNNEDKYFLPQDLYVNSKNLVIIGQSYSSSIDSRFYGGYNRETTRILVYDISNKDNLKNLKDYRVREIELDGYYQTSRLIGSKLYAVSNKNIYMYPLYYSPLIKGGYQSNTENNTEDIPIPSYYDSSIGKDYINVNYSDIHYLPGSIEQNYMMLAGINLDNLGEKVNIFTCLGSSNNIYASDKNLYTAVTKYEYDYKKADTVNSNMSFIWFPRYSDVSTLIYKFSLDDGNIEYKASGKVPGSILNQFSMDEYKENFRVTTTKQPIFDEKDSTQQNNLYMLDDKLNISGKVEGLAPGERIYSTRFIGDRAYIVTFKNIDPLFVVDLKDSTAPKVLGNLKIPGFSTYIHPYDENHIIGFGKDTKEDTQGTQAISLGMKMALFDVTDPTNPKQQYVENIGDRGTDSELLYNHKALLFSKDKNIIAFPVSIMEYKDSGSEVTNNQYGYFKFGGAYIYSLDLNKGFNLKGKITHLSDQDYNNAEQYGYYGDKSIDRILYINDALYTISKSQLKANNIDNLSQIGNINLSDKYADYDEYKKGSLVLQEKTENNLNNGDIGLIELSQNPSTGYYWTYSIEDPNLIQQVSEKNFDFNEENIVGGSSQILWKLKALNPGKTKIIFKYSRGWEANIEPIETREFTLNVK